MVASRRFAAVALLAGALLAGCSDTGGGSSPTAQASGDADAGVVAWADGVCTATTDLEAAVQEVSTGLQVDPTASGEALDRARTEVAERVGAVRVAADDLRAAVSTSPPGVLSKELAAAQDELSATADRAHAAVEELAAQGAALADAGTPAGTAAALTAAGGALAAVGTGVQTYLASLRESADSQDPVLREAFAEAPACKARKASASPSP
jgi:hypothetical protein